jgi:methylmalonyl-CoA/ethylmalonyl-CoA epimerase
MEKILHIGIAIRDSKQAVLNLSNLLGIEEPPLNEYKTESLHYQIGLVRVGEVELELIEPRKSSGMAEEHIREFGQGVYHIAIAVNNLTEAIERYKQRGFESQEIRRGIHGARVCFLKNQILPGIYFELVETPVAVRQP